RRSVWPLLIKHGVLFFLVGCERGQRSRFLAKKRVEALCLPFLPRAGSIQILPPGKPGTPPCKSGQLEKDLGLEVSSARHAARLIISEIMRSFFSLVQGAPVPHGTRTTLTRRMMRCGLTSADSGLQLDLEIALNGVSAKIQPPPAFQPGRKCVETSDDVIEDDFTSTPGSRILDLSPMRLGAAKTKGNGRKRPVFLTAD